MRRISPTAFTIARRETLREINRKIALNLIRSRQPISRAELARLMGIRRGAISRLIDDLIRTNQVFEGAKGDSKRGRKPRQLYIETRRRCAVAIDISATRTLMQVTDPLGHPLLDVQDLPTRSQPTGLIRQLAEHIRGILAGHPEVGNCLGVGVAIAGLVDQRLGRLRYAPTLGWSDVDIRAPLEEVLGLPVVVENSVKACVLAQVWAARSHAPVDGTIVFVNASEGVGAGIAIDGQLLRGAHNGAGEFGHIVLDPNGPRCSCGANGCWEAYVSVRATIARYLGKDPSWPASAALHEPSIPTIVARARSGEPRALETLRETGHYLGRGLATIVNAVEPRRIYFSGEVTDAWDLVLPPLREAMRELSLDRETDREILTVPVDEHPRLRGAVALVTSAEFAAPVVA